MIRIKVFVLTIPSLFTPRTDRPGPAAKASILREPPAVLTRKRSMALPPLDVSQPSPEKQKCDCPPKKKATVPIAELPDPVDVVGEDLNDTLPTLYSDDNQHQPHHRWKLHLHLIHFLMIIPL